MRIVLLVLLAACGGKEEEAPVLPDDTGPTTADVCEVTTARITGRVTTFAGQPLIESTVTFEPADGDPIDAALDREGKFDEDLEAGTWTILAVHSGCAEGRMVIEVVACEDREYIVELDC